MVRLAGSTASLPQKEENSTPRFPTAPFVSSLNPLRELLNTVLRELGEKPYFADANTAAIPAIRGPRKSERSSASGYLNCTNVPSNYTAGDFEVKTNIGESYKKKTNHHAERPHTPNYNFLKQHLLDLTNWCLARGSHYDRLDGKDASTTPIFDGNANASKSSTKGSPQAQNTTESVNGAEELAITYWDPETVYAVLYTIATIVRRVDDVGVYSPAASFASPNLKERLLSGVGLGKESTTDTHNTGRRKSATGDAITSARTTHSLLSLDVTDGGQSALANDDTGLAYIAPLRLCTPSEVLHLLHMCAEAATCFTVVASSQLDMPQVMLRVYSIDPKLSLSANPEANRQTLLNSVSNIPHHCSKAELAVLRGQMRRTAELFCSAFASALLSHAPHQADRASTNSGTAPKNSRGGNKRPNNNNASTSTSLTLSSDSADAKREPKSLYFMWLMYKTLSEALHGGNGMGGGNLDSVYFGSLGGGGGGDSPFPNPLQSANHHDPLSTTMRTRSRSTGLEQGGSAGNRASSPSTDLQTFFEEIRKAIHSQQEVESVLSPLRRRSVGPNSAPTVPLAARSSPTATGFNARRRAGSRRLHSLGSMVEYRHPQYFPLLAELLSALCAFWKKQAYSLVKEVLAPSEGGDVQNPLLIGERNARLQQEAEQRRDAAFNARYSTKPSGKKGEEAGKSAVAGCAGPSAVRTRGVPPALPTTRYGASSSSSTALQAPSTSTSLTAVSSRLQLYERLLAAEQRRQEELLNTARDGDANMFERSLLEGPTTNTKAAGITGTGGRNKNVVVEDVAESVAYKSTLAAGTELTATVGSVKSSTIQDFFAPRQRIAAFAKEMLAEIHLEARGSVQTDATTTSATDASLVSGVAEPKYVPMSQREPIEHEPEEEMVKRLSSITNMGRSLGDLYATLDSNALLSIKREFVAIREAEEKSMPPPANRRFFKQPTTRHTLASNAQRTQKAANKASASEIAEAKKRSLLPAQFSWVSGGELRITAHTQSTGTPTAAGDSSVPAAATAIAAAAAASAASHKKDGKKGGVAASSPVTAGVGQVDAPRFFLIRSPDTPLSGDFRGRHAESTPLGAKPTAGAFSANSTLTTINGSTVSLPLPDRRGASGASDDVPNFIKAVTKVAANAQLGINPPPATAAELLRVINKEDLPLGLVRLKAAIVGHNASSLFLASLHAERFCYAQALHSMHAKLSTIENAYERRRVEREWVSTLAAEVEHAVNVCRYQHLDLLVEVIEADLEANVHPNEQSVVGTLPDAPARAVSLLVDPSTAAADPTERLFVDLLRQRLQVDNLGFASKRLHAHRYFTPVSFVLESTLRQMLSPILLLRLQRAVFRFRRLGGGVPSSLLSPNSNAAAYGGSSSNATVPVGSAMNHPAYSADAAMFETFGQPANIIAFALLLRDDAFGTVKPSTTPVASPRRRGGAAANNAAPQTADAFAPPLVPEELRDVFLSLWEVVAHTFMKHNKIIGYRIARQEEKVREEKHAADARELKKEASWRCFSGLQSRTSSFQKPRSEDASAHTAAGAGDERSGSTPISCGDSVLPPVHPVTSFAGVATPLNNIPHVPSPPSSARSDYAAAAFNTLSAKRRAHRLQEDADFLKIEATKKQRCLGTILWLLVSLSHYMVGDSRGHHAAPLIGILQCSHRCFPLVVEMLDYALCVKSEVLILLRKIEEEKLRLRNGHESVVSPAAAHIMNLAGSVNVVAAGASGSAAGSPVGGGLSGSGFNRSRQSSNAAALDINGSPRFSSGSAPAAAFDAGLGYTPAPKMSKPQGSSIPNTVGGDDNTIFGALESKPTRRAAYNALLVPQMALYEQLLLVQGIVHHGLEVSDVVLSTFSNRHLHSNNVYSHNFFYLSKKATGSYDGSGLRTGVGRGLGFASNSAHTPLGAGGRSATTRPFLDSATDPMASAREAALAEKIARLIRPTVENQIHAILSLVFLQHSSNSVAAGIASHTRSILLAFTPGAHHMQVAQQMSAAAAAAEANARAQSGFGPEGGDANVTSARTAERNSGDSSSKGANNSNPSTTATSTINEHTSHNQQQQAGGDPALGSGNSNIRFSASDAFGPNTAAMQSQSHLINNANQSQHNDAPPKPVNAHRDPFNMGADAASSLAHSDTDSEEGDEMAELRRGLLELKARMQPYIDDQRRVDGDLNSSLRDLTGILEKYRQATSTAANGAGGGVAGSTFYWPQGMPSAMLDSMNYVSETAWLASEARGFADASDYYTNPTPHNAYPTPSHDASDTHHTVEDSRGDAIGSDYSEDPSSNAQGLDVPSVLTDFGYISLYLLPLPLLYLHQVRLIRHYRCVHKYYSQRLRVWLMGRQRKLEMKGRIRVASAAARQKRRRQRAEKREAEASAERAESARLASSAKGSSTQRRTSSPGNVADRSWRRRQSIDTQPPSSAATSFRRAPAAAGGAVIEEPPQSPGGTLRIADMSFTTALGDSASPTAMSTLTYNKNTLKPSSGGNRRKRSGGADSSGSDAESDGGLGALSKESVEATLRNLGSTASTGHLPSIVNSTALLPTTAQLVKVINDRSFREKRKMRMMAEANRRSRLRRSNSNSYVLSGAARAGVKDEDDDNSSETTDDDYADALEQPLFVLHDFAEHERLQEMAQINERSARGTESNASSTFGGAPPSFYHTDHPLDFLLDPYLGCSMVLLSASASYLDDDQGQPGDSDDDESGGAFAGPTDMAASSPLLPGGGSKYMEDSRVSDNWAAADGKSSSPFGEDSCVIGQNNGRPPPIGLGRYGVPLTAAPTESAGYTASEIKRRLVENYTVINNNFADYEGLDRVIQMNEMFVHQKHNFRSVVLLLSHEMLQLVEDSISMCQRPTAVSASSPADASGAPAHNNINSVLMTTMTNGVSNSVPSWMRVSAGGNPQALAAQQAKNAGGDDLAASSASPDRGSMGLSMNPAGELRSSFSLSFAANNGAASPLSAARSGVFDNSARDHSPNRAGHGGGESTTVAHDVSLMITNPQLEETSMLSHAYSPIMARPKWKVAYFRFLYVLFLQQYHSKAFLFAKRERAKAGTVPGGGASGGVAVGGGRSAASEGGLGATTRTTLANLSHIDASNLSHVGEGVRKGRPAANNDVSSSSDEEDARKPSTSISPAISTSNTPERQKINTRNAHHTEDLEAVSPRSHVERSSSYTEQHFKGLRALLDSDPMVKSNFIVERQVANEIKTLRRRHNRSYYRCWDVLIPRQQMLVGKFTERMVTFLLSAIRLMVELDDESCFVLQPRKGPEEAMSARPTRGRSTEEGCAAGFSLERVSLRDKAYKLGIVPTLTKEIDLENTLHEYQHRQMKRRNRSATISGGLASSSARARAGSMSPSKMTSLFPPASPQKGASSSRNEFDSDVNSSSNVANNSRSGDNEALATEERSTRIDATTSRTSPSATPAVGVPKIPSLTFPLPAPQSPRNAHQTPTSARGGLPPLHPMSSRGTPRLAGMHSLSPRLNMGSPRGAGPAPAPAPTKPKLPFAMPRLALNLAPPPIYYTSSGDTAAAAEGQLCVEQGQIDVPPPAEASAPAPAPTKPKFPFALPKLALNLAPPPIYYTSSGDTAAAAEGQLSNEATNFASPQSNVSLNIAFSPTPSPAPTTSASPAPTKPKLPFAMPKLALNLAPPPIYYTSSGDTAAAAEGQLSNDLTMQQTAWLPKPVTDASPNSSPLPQSLSIGSSPPAPTKPKLPFSMPKLALNLAPPPIYYTSSGDTAAAAEGQLGEDLSLFKQQTEITGPFGSMSPMRAASVATTVSPSEPPSNAASPPKLPFAMPKLALNRAPPPIYYTSSGDTAAAAEGQLSNEAATFAMPEFGNKGQQQQPARPASVPPVQIRKLALGSLSIGSRDSEKDTKKEGTPRVAQRSPRVVSVIGEPVSTVVAHGSSPLEGPSPNKPKIPLIPILKPPSQQDPNSAPNSVSARGEQVSARGATGKPFSHPLIIKKLQIAPHPQVVDPQSEGTDDEGGVSARGGDGDYFGAASPRSTMPGMGDLTKEGRTSFQGFVASEAFNSEEETLAELLGTNISPSSPAARAHQSPSIFVPSALVSDRERRYGTSSASASASYAPLEQVRRSSVSLIGPLITDDGPGFRSSGQGAVVASRDTNSVVAGGYVHSRTHSMPTSGFVRKGSSLAPVSPRGGLLNSQLPRAASVVAGDHAATRQYRSSQFGRSESISSSPLAAAQGGGVCGTVVADRGTFPVQLLMDTNAFMRHHRRTSRPIYASLHVHAQVLYLLMALLLRGLTGTSNPIIHPSANIRPGRRGPYYHSMGAASRNNATCGTLDERYSAAFSNLINNPANSAGVAVGGLGGGQNVLHPLHKHMSHPLNQPAVRHLHHLIQSENLNQGLAVLMRLLTACGQSEGIDGLPAPVLGRLYMGLDSSNQGQTASSATGASFVGAPLVPYNAAVGGKGDKDGADDDRRPSGSAPNTPSTPQLLTATGRTNEAPSLLLTAPPLSDLHKHRGTSTVVNIPMGAKMIGKGGYGTVLASNVAVVYSTPNDALPNPAAAPLNPEQLADQALFHHFVGAYLFGDNTNNLAVINSQPVVSASPEIVSVGFGVDHGRHSMSFPVTPSTTVVDPKTGATKTPSLVSLPIAVKLIAVPTFAEDRCALYSLHSEVLIMLRAQDGGRYRTGNVLNAPLVGNPAPNNCSELLDFGCSGNQYFVVMKRYPTSVKDWRERLVWESTHLVKGRRANLNIEVSESLVEKELAAQQKEAAESRREALNKARRGGRRTSESGGGGGDKLDATAGTMSPHTSGNVSSAEEGDGTLSSAESSSEESFDSDDSFAETRSERKRREVRREKERLAEKIRDQIFDTHKKASDDVLWLAATNPPPVEEVSNLSPEVAAEVAKQSLISGKPKPHAAVPEVKNPVLATMFPVLAHLFIQMLDTILALHQRSSTIHYDIKCDNFFLDFSDCGDRETEDLVKETLASAGAGGGSSKLFNSMMGGEDLDPVTIAARERLERLNQWAEEGLMMATVPGADGTLPQGNMVKVRLGDFGESYINSKFAVRQAVNAQTQKARLERYWRLLEEQKKAISKIRQSVKMGKTELSTDDDEDSPTRIADDGDLSDDLTDHFITNVQTSLNNAISNAAARGEFVADDDRYESASDEGGNDVVEDRRHSSDPDTDPDDLPATNDQFETATKRATQVFVNQTPVPSLGIGFRQDMNPYSRRMSMQAQFAPPMSARSGSGNRSSHDGALSARFNYNQRYGAGAGGSSTTGDSPTITTPTTSIGSGVMGGGGGGGGGLPPAMHLRLHHNIRSSPVNNRNTPLSARLSHQGSAPAANVPSSRRGGPMILHLALAQTARNPSGPFGGGGGGGNTNSNNNGSNGSIPNSARYAPAPSARYGYSANNYNALPSARNGGNKASATSKLDKRYARGTEIIRPPELLLPHKFLADRRRRTHRTGYESDIWAVGCLLYELLTGDFLFYENLFPKMLARVANHDEPLMEDSHREMLNNDTDIINFLHFVLTRDPQRRPLLTEVRRRFVLLAQKKLSQQFSNVRKYLRITNPTANEDHIKRLAGALGFSAKIPTVLTKAMLLPVECRRNVLKWTLEHYDGEERERRMLKAKAKAAAAASASAASAGTGLATALMSLEGSASERRDAQSPSPIKVGSSVSSPTGTAAPVSLSRQRGFSDDDEICEVSVSPMPPAVASEEPNRRPSIPSLSIATMLTGGGEKNNNGKNTTAIHGRSTAAHFASSGGTNMNTAANALSTAPQALRTFHTFIIHSLLVNEALPLYKAWRGALVANRLGLTGVCLPIAENDGSNTISAVAQGHRYQQAKAAAQNNGSMTSRSRAAANTTDFYLNAAAAHLAASSSSGLVSSSTSHPLATSASASDPSGLVAELSADPLISDDAVESILESTQGYGLAATVSAQRVNGYKRDAMVGARGWEAIEKEKAIAAAAAEFSFGANATASPLNNVISAASVPDALYGASPIVNVTNLISILANSYLILGLETDDADAAIPDLPTAEDFMAAGIFDDDDDNTTNHGNTSRHFDDLQSEDLCFDRDDGFDCANSGSEESLANSVVSELQDNARHMDLLSPPYGRGPQSASPRYVFPPSSVKNSFSVHVNASGAVPLSSSTAAGPRTKLTPEMISAMHSTKYSSSSASSLSVRTLQQHGITHVLSFGPLPGVAKHFHYLDMSPFLSRYEAEASAIKTAVENGTFEQMMQSYTQQMNANANALHKSGADGNINNGSKSARGVAPNPFGMSTSLFAAAAAAQNNGSLSARGSPSPLYGASANIKKSMAGGGDTREEQIASRLRPLHNAFVSWMVHGSSRTFCEHAASICGRVLVVPMIVMPTSVPRWVPMPLNIVCTPDASNETLYSTAGGPASTANPCNVSNDSVIGLSNKPSASRARLSTSGGPRTSPADHGTSNSCSPNLQSRTMNPNAKNSPSTAALAGASPSPTSGPLHRLSAAQQKRLSINSASTAAATAPPTHSVDMTLVWLLVYLTQTHRLPIITAMAHISNLCPILFQPQPQHRYLIDASSDAYTSRAVNGLGVATPATVAAATQQAAGHQQQEPQLNGSSSPQQANSPLRRGRQSDGGATTSFALETDANANTSTVPQILFVRAAAPVVIDPLQCIQAAVSILELYRMLTPAEFAMLGVVTPPPIYQLMCGPSELPAPGCATPLFGALGGNQSVRDRTALLMGLAFKEMYTAFEKKARGLVRNHMALGTPSLKASLPYADSAALWGLVVKFVAKHVLSDEGTASAPRPMKPCPDDALMTKEERKRINKAAALYSPITLKLKMLWHRCLCAATLYPSVEISPSHSFFREGRTPLFASEHSVATQKLVLFDRNPAPIPVESPLGTVGAPVSPTTSRRSLGPKARHHTNLVKHARWLVNESILPFVAKTRYVHGEVAVRAAFPSASTAACALAPQSNLLRCGSSIFGSNGGASAIRTPYSVKLTPSPNPDTVQWQAVPRKPTQANEKDKPFSPAFTILVCAMEGFLQQESIAAKRRESMRSREGAAAQYQNHRAAAGSTGEIVVGTDARGSIYHAFGSGSISATASATPSTTSPSPMRSTAALRPSEGGDVASPLSRGPGAAPSAFDPATADIEPTDFAVITNVAIALSEVVLVALNALCAFPDALANLQQLVTSVGAPQNHLASASSATSANANAGDGHIYSCRHCAMPTHVRLPNDLRSGKDLTKEERDAEAEEGSIVTTRTYTVCPQGLALATAANCNILDPLLQSWYVHQHMHPRPE